MTFGPAWDDFRGLIVFTKVIPPVVSLGTVSVGLAASYLTASRRLPPSWTAWTPEFGAPRAADLSRLGSPGIAARSWRSYYGPGRLQAAMLRSSRACRREWSVHDRGSHRIGRRLRHHAPGRLDPARGLGPVDDRARSRSPGRPGKPHGDGGSRSTCADEYPTIETYNAVAGEVAELIACWSSPTSQQAR